jgi:hypothetical protein
MKFSKKTMGTFLFCFVCILMFGLILYFIPSTKHLFLKSKQSSINSNVKYNTHANRDKIQEIVENNALTRKQKAQMANNLGFQLFKKNRYSEATEYFEFALEYDNTYVTAHHNLACALLKEDAECKMLKAFHEILFELRLDPLRKEIVENDSDLISMRLTDAFSILRSGFPQNDSLLKIMLVRKWYKIKKMAFDSDIHFGSNTKGTFSRISKDGKIEKTEFSYYVIDRLITITYTDESGENIKKQLQADYDMDRMILIRDIDGFDSWSEFNECD